LTSSVFDLNSFKKKRKEKYLQPRKKEKVIRTASYDQCSPGQSRDKTVSYIHTFSPFGLKEKLKRNIGFGFIGTVIVHALVHRNHASANCMKFPFDGSFGRILGS
jgi:hypothetical protein